MSETPEDIIARAICNGRKPKPYHGDAYDNLKLYADHGDADALVEQRWDSLVAKAVIAALEGSGYILVSPNSIQLPRNQQEAAAMFTVAEAFLKSPPPPPRGTK